MGSRVQRVLRLGLRVRGLEVEIWGFELRVSCLKSGGCIPRRPLWRRGGSMRLWRGTPGFRFGVWGLAFGVGRLTFGVWRLGLTVEF